MLLRVDQVNGVRVCLIYLCWQPPAKQGARGCICNSKACAAVRLLHHRRRGRMIGANPDGQHARAFLALGCANLPHEIELLTQSCAHAPASAESISHLPRRTLSGTSSIFPSFASQSLKSGGTGRCGSINMPEFTARLAGLNT